MDWKTISNNVLLVGLFVAMVTMFNQVNGRLDTMNERMEQMQAETNRRFGTLQAETSRRFDTLQAENNRRFDEMQAEMNRRFDRVDERFDQIFEALRVFEGRVTRLEEKAGIGPENAE
jgi:DNA anti-recombination protein RmuC